jgi:hypothetical protein
MSPLNLSCQTQICIAKYGDIQSTCGDSKGAFCRTISGAHFFGVAHFNFPWKQTGHEYPKGLIENTQMVSPSVGHSQLGSTQGWKID